VALCFNGVCQAVMMASPNDLKAFALGFSISEGLIDGPQDILAIDCEAQSLGWQVNVSVLAACEHKLKTRRRVMAGPSGCGLCGIDSLEAAMATQDLLRGLPRSLSKAAPTAVAPPEFETIELAKRSLNRLQKQHHYARGHHTAALFDDRANALAISEDVGRHSALDKLIGRATLDRQPLNPGFAMLTSRCSHDLVIKCARSGITCLVTLAPPTDLAVQSASQLGLTLLCFQQSQLKHFA